MAGGIDWFRWHHGSVTDPKFALVAKKSGSRLGDVIALWAFLLERASASEERGQFDEVDAEVLELMFGLDEGQCTRILRAMEERGLIAGDRVTNWEKRQPKRERPDDNSTDRVRTHRATKRQETPNPDDGTPCNATERQETPRGEESREEKKEEKALSGKPDDADRESARPDSVAVEVLEYLNAKTGKSFRPVRTNLSLIQARLRESACPEDLKAVIDAKVAQWRDDPKMGQYLRPETLFNAQKFASYIGQLERKPRADWWLKHGFGSEREALEAGVSDGVTA